jgi:DNA polymerase-3 subunit alpha
LQIKKKLQIKRAQALSEIFGKDNFYLELQKHTNIKDQDILNEKLINLSQKLGLPLVATNDNHYIFKEDAEAQEALLCIQTQTTLTLQTENFP